MDNTCKIIIIILSLALIFVFVLYINKDKAYGDKTSNNIDMPFTHIKERYSDDDDEDVYRSIKKYRNSKDNVYKKYLEFNNRYGKILKEIRKNDNINKNYSDVTSSASTISSNNTNETSSKISISTDDLPYIKKYLKPNKRGKCPPCFYPKKK
jgi:hypothetical protein